MEETYIEDIGQGKSYQPEICFHPNFQLCQQTLYIKIASQSEI